MSESSRTTTDGGASETLNVEDLFAHEDTDLSIDDAETTTTEPETETTTAAAEDATAGEVFAQLREDVDDEPDAAGDVADESLEDIMARADEETQHVDQIDDAIRADEGALDDLLLTERRQADGFLWVETEDDGDDATDVASLFESTDDAIADATGTEADDATQDPVDDAADDDLALDTAVDSSFEERAASFDDSTEAFHVDASNFETTTEADSGRTVEGNRGASTDDTDSTDPTDGTSTEKTTETSKSDDSDDDSGGLASRIRSILSG